MGVCCSNSLPTGKDPKAAADPPPKQNSNTTKSSAAATASAGRNETTQGGRRAKCPHCNQWVSTGELTDHTQHCPERKVSCQNTWCNAVVHQKDLTSHMTECARSRQTRCSKCGDMVSVVEVATHRAQCVTKSCEHCGEEVIPRLIKYCPNQLYRNVVYRKGPFASAYLHERFFNGKSTSSAASPIVLSLDPAAAAAAASSGNSNSGGDAALTNFASNMTGEVFDAIKEPALKAKTVNFNVARVQHLWRWARARCVIEDILFRLIYKEQDNKKESFSVFARTRDRYFDYADGGQGKLRLVNSATAAPAMAEAPTSGHYFPTQPKAPLTPDILDRVVHDLSTGVKIPYYAVFRVFSEAAEHLKKFPNVQVVPTLEGARYSNGRWVQGARATVVGDLHGQLQDLLYILQQNGKPSPTNVYVFNGDFVDRGPHGFEVFFLLCMLMLTHKGDATSGDSVFLNRGNHEVGYMNEEYGFDIEIQTKYDRNVFKLVQRCFNALPLATLIGRVFVVHAGPPRMPDITIGDINMIDRFREIPLPEHDQSEADEVFQDLLWSDPMERQGGGWVNSERGVGVLYGADISGSFMRANNLSLIIRSHETFMRGYEEHHGGKVVTVFSCSNYDGPETNFGSFINLVGGSDQPSFHTYSVTAEEYITDGSTAPAATTAEDDMLMTRTMTSHLVGADKTGLLGGVFWFTGLLHNRSKSTREDVLRSLRESIFERRHKLLAYFSKIDRTRQGTVWKMEWTEALRGVLNLEVPWFFLRQYLCDTEEGSQRINYVKFLKRFRTAISRCYIEDWVINAVAELHSLTKLRKNGEAVRSLMTQSGINYNTFCSVFKKIDYNLSDNALFELFIAFDENNTGVISGAEYLQFLESAAADVEARRSRAHRIANGQQHSNSNNDDLDDEGADSTISVAWDLDAMNELERIIYTSRSSLHAIFRLESKNSLVNGAAFVQGVKNLIRAVKKLNAISNENIDAMWSWVASENSRASLSLEELFMCFLVRDFVLLGNRLTWLGENDDIDAQVSPFFTMAWLVQPAPATGTSATPPSRGNVGISGNTSAFPSVTPKLGPSTPMKGALLAAATAAVEGASSSTNEASPSSDKASPVSSSRSSSGGKRRGSNAENSTDTQQK